MGKAFIIKDVDWSSRNLGRVSFKDGGSDDEGRLLEIIGDSTITSASVYYVTLNGEFVNAIWSISSTQYATLEVGDDGRVIVTPKTSGNVVLTATYNGITATKSITVQVENVKTLYITGSTAITGPAEYRCYYGDTLVAASYFVAPTGVVTEYVDQINKYVRLTPVQSGTIRLSAVYQDVSTGLDITVTVEEEEPDTPDNEIIITQNDLVDYQVRYYKGGSGGSKLRGVICIPDVNKDMNFTVYLKNKDDSSIRCGLLFVYSLDIYYPSIEGASSLSNGSGNTYFDSGWLAPGQSISKNQQNLSQQSGTSALYKNCIISFSGSADSDDYLPSAEEVIQSIEFELKIS